MTNAATRVLIVRNLGGDDGRHIVLFTEGSYHIIRQHRVETAMEDQKRAVISIGEIRKMAVAELIRDANQTLSCSRGDQMCLLRLSLFR